MKAVIKKYWWAFLLILSAPLIVNAILIIDTPLPSYTSDGKNGWLEFWGSYLGAFFPFIILLITLWDNHKENIKDRKIQLATIEYQVSKDYINSLKQHISNYIQTLNFLELELIAHRPHINTGQSLNKLWEICQNKTSTYELLELSIVDLDDEKEKEYKKFLFCFKTEYDGLIKDFAWVLDHFLYNKVNTDAIKELASYRTKEMEMSIVYDENKRIWNIVDEKNCNIIENGSKILNELLERLEYGTIYSKSKDFIKYEKSKMDNALNTSKK